MDLPALRYDLNHIYALGLPEAASLEALETILAEKVNDLILHDFNALVQLLYRIDINESKLKNCLKENTSADAGPLIARLILERQWQKIETRRKFSR